MPASLPINFFLIHAPDTDLESAVISNLLNSIGFTTLTYHQAYEGWLHSEIYRDIYPALSEMLAFIFIGSPKFFKDDFLTEIAHEAQSQKKAIFITITTDTVSPEWFSSIQLPISGIQTAGSQSRNVLISKLNRYSTHSQFMRKS